MYRLNLSDQGSISTQIDVIIIDAGDFLVVFPNLIQWIILLKDAFAKTAQNQQVCLNFSKIIGFRGRITQNNTVRRRFDEIKFRHQMKAVLIIQERQLIFRGFNEKSTGYVIPQVLNHFKRAVRGAGAEGLQRPCQG